MPDSTMEDSPAVTEEDVSNPFEAKELELIVAALQSLQDQGSSDNDDDSLERLLKKVQAVKEETKSTPFNLGLSRSGRINSVNSQLGAEKGYAEIDHEQISQVVQAASDAAVMASNAALAVASSINRNSRAMEKLCKALDNNSNASKLQGNGTDEEEGAGGSSDRDLQHRQIVDIVLQDHETTKALVRQNRITHVVLGLMVVSSFVWRYGIINFVQKIHHTIQNPLQGVKEMMDNISHAADPFKLTKDDHKDGHEKDEHHKADHHKDDSHDSPDVKMPQFKFPHLLKSDDKETEQSNLKNSTK